jgi:hypothetical protein
MTSQLNVDTIVDKAGSSGPSLPNTTTIKISNTSTNVSDDGAVTQNLVQGLLKAWVHAHEHARQDSFNISSETDTSTGDYTFTYTNNFSSDNYCAAASNQSTRNGQGLYVGNFATSTFRINPSNASGSSTDYNTTTVISGDLA